MPPTPEELPTRNMSNCWVICLNQSLLLFLAILTHLFLDVTTDSSLSSEVLSDGTIRREGTSNLLKCLGDLSTLVELFSNCAVLVEHTVVLGSFLCFAANRALLGELLADLAVSCEGSSDFLGLAANLTNMSTDE